MDREQELKYIKEQITMFINKLNKGLNYTYINCIDLQVKCIDSIKQAHVTLTIDK